MSSGIYGIHNLVNDKWYVGQAANIRMRWNAHRSLLSRGARDSIHLLRAWKKYGADAFEWVILEECPVEELDQKEIEWINRKDSYRNGYNRTIGGGGCRGFSMPESAVQSRSETTKAYWADPVHREFRLARMHETMTTPEYRAKLSAAGQRNWRDPAFRDESLRRMQEGAREPEKKAKRCAAVAAALQRPSTRALLSESSKKNWQSEEYREKIASKRSEWLNDEYRETVRQKSLARWQDPVERAKMCAGDSRAARKRAPRVVLVETGQVFECAADAAESLGLKKPCHIGSVCRGKRNTAYGYHWRYATDDD